MKKDMENDKKDVKKYVTISNGKLLFFNVLLLYGVTLAKELIPDTPRFVINLNLIKYIIYLEFCWVYSRYFFLVIGDADKTECIDHGIKVVISTTTLIIFLKQVL